MMAWVLPAYDQGGLALALNSQELALLGDLTSNTIFNCSPGCCRPGARAGSPSCTWRSPRCPLGPGPPWSSASSWRAS